MLAATQVCENFSILIVDDNALVRHSLKALLGREFEVSTTDSGESCIAMIESGFRPDALLLDVDLGSGIDGFETARRSQRIWGIPVIIVSGTDTLEQRMAAFDCGAIDFIAKPFDAKLMPRKILALARHLRIVAQSGKPEPVALGLSPHRESLLDFMQRSLGIEDTGSLAESLLETCATHGVLCHVALDTKEGSIAISQQGPSSPLDREIIEHCKGMGQTFRFASRLIVNYENISVLVPRLPADASEADDVVRLIEALCECAQAIIERIEVRSEAAKRAEALQAASLNAGSLQRLYQSQQIETRMLLEDLIQKVEMTFASLELSQSQEEVISDTLRDRADRILQLFDLSEQINDQLALISNSLESRSSANLNCLF